VTWGDVKSGDYTIEDNGKAYVKPYRPARRHETDATGVHLDATAGVEIARCEFYDAWDAIRGNTSTQNGTALDDVEVHDCEFYDTRDDCFQLGSNASNIHAHDNTCIGPGAVIGRDGKGNTPGDPFTKWIHHNIMDSRAKQQFRRGALEGQEVTHYGSASHDGRLWLAPIGWHQGSSTTNYYGTWGDPYAMYYNTFLYGNANGGAGTAFYGYGDVAPYPSSDDPQRVYNNIFYQIDPEGVINAGEVFDSTLIEEGNLYYRVDSDPNAPLWWTDDETAIMSFEDYQAEDDFLDPFCTDEDVWANPGFTPGGLEEGDYEPTSVACGGVDLWALPGLTGIPTDKLATDFGVYRGAVPPLSCFEISLPPTLVMGDMNCDDEINYTDWSIFLGALNDPETYCDTYPEYCYYNGDMNCNGTLDFGDMFTMLDCTSDPNDCPAACDWSW
jgi:hypothetical protein